MNYMNKANIPVAVTDNSKFDLSHTHLLTGDFFGVNVSWLHEMVPGSKIDVNLETFARLEPLVTPTYGRCRIVNRAFVVPFRQLYPNWDDFLADTVAVPADNDISQLQSQVPTVSNLTLMNAFVQSVTPTAEDMTGAGMVTQTSAASYDFTYAGVQYKFTVKGRRAYTLLTQLGYRIIWDEKIVKDYNALPLLCLAKVFSQYYYPSMYQDTGVYDFLERITKYNVSSPTGYVLTEADVRMLLTACSYSYYDATLDVNAWDTPNQPSTGLHTDFKLANIDSVGSLITRANSSTTALTNITKGYVTNNSGSISAASEDWIGGVDAPFISPIVNGTAASSANYSSPTPISEFLLDSLHALSSFMKRNQISGARSWERLLSRYGVSVPSAKLNRPVYLGASSQDVQIGDVMSTSDTVAGARGLRLGDYSGKGVSYSNGANWTFEASEFCYLIVITTILPESGFGVQGQNPQTLRIFKNSYYIPEFDAMGTEPLPSSLVYVPNLHCPVPFSDIGSQIFGFVPRYATYKYESDAMTGNYNIPSLNAATPGTDATSYSENAWNVFRLFNDGDFPNGSQDVVHSLDYMYGGADHEQYRRIFYSSDPTDPDPFRLIQSYNVAEYAPMKPLYDTYDFHDYGKGKKVSLEVNGVKAN